MRTVVITGGTGDLGRVVVPRLEREYHCIPRGRRDSLDLDAPIYALVHLAGAFAPGNDFDAMLAANLMAAVQAVTALAPKLDDGGHVVAISSIAAKTRPAGLGAYAASKAAMEAYLDTVAKELAPRGIRIDVLHPGTIDTFEKRAEIAETIASILAGNA
jgi:NAD(P)-dependent dehydrogenase (short-subunit alcohol dehydrogenase family)